MDALLQLLLTEMPSVGGLERQQRFFIWDGKEYPQDPATYSFGPRVVMLESKVAPYLFRFLPPEYAERQWIPLDVGNETLDLFEQEVNGNEIDWFGHRPDDLIRSLLEQNTDWVLIFEPNYDQIDNVYRIGADEGLRKLRRALDRKTREGLIIYPPDSLSPSFD